VAQDEAGETLARFLEAVGDHFGRTGEWPEVQGLQRRLDHEGRNVDIDGLRPKLDPDLGEIQNGVAWLTLHGLHDAGRHQEVDDYLAAVRLSYERYADRAVESPEIRAEDFDSAGLDALRKKKVRVLLQQEGAFLGGGGATGESWHYSITAHIRDYAGVDSYESYVRVHPRRTGFLMTAAPPSAAPTENLHVGAPAVPLGTPGIHLRDQELLGRCADLLGAAQNYDRAIREATVVLEDRVRKLAKTPSNVIGTALMEQAFGPANGRLRLRTDDNEQRGAMELFRGTVAYFRNETGHRLVADYDRDDALEFVGFVDLLLTSLDRRLLRRRRASRKSREPSVGGHPGALIQPTAGTPKTRAQDAHDGGGGGRARKRIVIRAGTDRRFLIGSVGGPWYYSCSGTIRVYNPGPERLSVREGWWIAEDGTRIDAYVPRKATLAPGDPELLLKADRDDLVRLHEGHSGVVRMAVLLAGDDTAQEETVPSGWIDELRSLQDHD
jgi:uncharacterized protein (TIGR02391 family)